MTIKCQTTTTSYDYSSLIINNLFFYSFLIYLTSSIVSSAPISGGEDFEQNQQEHRRLKLHKDFQFIRSQLEEYGYLRAHPTLHEFRKALKHFQNVLGVEETAEIDEATVLAAKKPRCSHEDVMRHHHRNGGPSRSKRFSVSRQANWDSKHFSGNSLRLKWFISSYSNDMSREQTQKVVRKAFELWAHQSNIKSEKKVSLHFSEAASKEDADIDILWANGPHGDEYDFDASSRKTNVLAHTFFPAYEYPLNGDIHFDDNVDWYVDSNSGEQSGKVFFPYVLAHEIGHSLGLHHSGRKDSLMYPYYKNVPLDSISLSVDDRCGINWNYAGNSQFCLFVWLMSELVEYRQDLMNGEHNGASPITGYRPPAKQPTKVHRIPKCTSHNEFRKNAGVGLKKHLQMTEEESEKYVEVLCNFLAGLHMHRATKQYSPGQSVELEFAGVNKQVNTFVNKHQLKRSLRHAEKLRDENQPSIFDPEYFDDAFFDKFFQEYYPTSME
ncbi:unnamed protein product [Caenorhabditis angaria]|uniref:Peptidase metallopeptidase domain-containing protein n=1 Tax=Caenorhabditis angaria TaxID=860376 RepID=A0A9P1N1J6_9PELO|nr:unnamed protein product [Caenorhabditis angaria]